MIINMENGTLKTYELGDINNVQLKLLMKDITYSTEPKHFVNIGESIKENDVFTLTGKEFNLYKNVSLNETGRTGYTGGFYNERSYKEYIREYDLYQTPKLYALLGKLLDKRDDSYCFAALARISHLCDLTKFPDKKLFDKYKKEILDLLYIRQVKNSKETMNIAKLYELLYEKNKELPVFTKKDFHEKYKIKTYDFKNITKK